VALTSSAGVAGKVIAGAIGDRFNPARIWAALMLPMAAGLLFAALGTKGISLYVYAILIGAGFGAAIVSQPATIADRFGTANFARVAGIVYLLQASAGIGVPALAGWAYSPAEGYRWSFIGVGLSCLVSAAFLVATCRRSLAGNRGG
jgi:MFS family permease